MSDVIRHEACPLCREVGHDRSGDNKAVYQDGSGYCFKCDEYFRADNDNLPVIVKKPVNKQDFIHGKYSDIPNRGISCATCKVYKYQVNTINGKSQHIANYYDSTGELQKQKIRTFDKKFFNLGNTSWLGFFGMNLRKPDKKLFLTITEGEIDALSVAQVFDCKFPVVSVPNGSSIKKEVAANREWLLGFKYIVAAFDGDDTGRALTKKLIEELPELLICVVNWPEGIKDASDLLQKGMYSALKDCIYAAAPAVPESIVDLGSIIEKSLEPKPVGLSWGWKGLDKATYGIRTSELILIGGGSSIGKTTLLNQVGHKLAFDHSKEIGIISFEQSTEEVSQRMAGLIINQRIWLPGAKYDKQKVIEAGRTLIGKAYAIDTSKGLDTVEKIVNKIIYMVKVLGIRYIFIDHLTYIASMIRGDERRGLDTVMAALSRVMIEQNCCLFVVSHLAKPVIYESRDSNTSKTFEQGRRVQATDYRGSQSLQYYATTIIALSRNILTPNSPMYVEILKNRIDGYSTGSIIQLIFNRDTGKYEEVEEIM